MAIATPFTAFSALTAFIGPLQAAAVVLVGLGLAWRQGLQGTADQGPTHPQVQKQLQRFAGRAHGGGFRSRSSHSDGRHPATAWGMDTCV
jgi:hypothetical protein